MHILPVFLVHVLMILISIHGTLFIHILHVFEGDIPEYLSRNDIFSPKSKKLHFRHRKYIYCINLCITCFSVFRVSMLVVYIHD